MARVPSIQAIFQQHFDALQATHRLTAPQYRAGRAIMACRTPAMGGHEQCCPDGHFSRVQYHSCKHRSCPTCAERAKHEWLDKQQQRLLPCDHFHVIFTVPHELIPIWQYNRREFTTRLFGACRDTLMQLLGQTRHLGATPGILMALHTWGRTLNQHPHIHCLVTAGGLSADQVWRDVAGDYLLPSKIVRLVFRGKLLDSLADAAQAGRLTPPSGTGRRISIASLLRAAARKTWNVRLESRYAHGRGVAIYLSRYVRGGPISNTRVVRTTGNKVRFRFRDHRDGRDKVRCLDATRFMEQLLWHVPEPGQHTVRHVGLYAHACRQRREHCRTQIDPQAMAPTPPQRGSWQSYLSANGRGAATRCPDCGKALRRGISIAIPQRGKQNSLIESPVGGMCNKTLNRTLSVAPFYGGAPPGRT